MRKLMIVFLWGFVVAIAGCQKTPLQKLESDVVFDDMNNVFWAKQLDGKTQLWMDALRYCQTHEEKPNCSAVIQLYVISNGSTRIVPYGSSGHYLTAPNI